MTDTEIVDWLARRTVVVNPHQYQDGTEETDLTWQPIANPAGQSLLPAAFRDLIRRAATVLEETSR